MIEFRLWPLKWYLCISDLSADSGQSWYAVTFINFDGSWKRGQARHWTTGIVKALFAELEP